MAINRLEATKAIHELNKGNKMNAQNHASVNKNLIMYNKLNKLIVSILNDDDQEPEEDEGDGIAKHIEDETDEF